jgi:hypothetical protein
MKTFKLFMGLMLLVSTGSVRAQVKTIEGTEFRAEMMINDQKTMLNGGGLREKLGFLDLYVGALYLPSKSSDASKIIMSDQAMGIRIVIVSALVTRERFIEALEEGFKNSSAGKYALNDIELFKQYLNDRFNKGDEILLTYHPGDAVYLYKNGSQRGSFPGLAFKQALFAIWLGDRPAQESLKKEMLGF